MLDVVRTSGWWQIIPQKSASLGSSGKHLVMIHFFPPRGELSEVCDVRLPSIGTNSYLALPPVPVLPIPGAG